MLVVAVNAISLATQTAHTLSLTSAVCLWRLPTSFCATGEISIVHEQARRLLAKFHECNRLLILRTKQEVCHRRSSAYASSLRVLRRQPNSDLILSNLPSIGDHSNSPFQGLSLSPILRGVCRRPLVLARLLHLLTPTNLLYLLENVRSPQVTINHLLLRYQMAFPNKAVEPPSNSNSLFHPFRLSLIRQHP